MKKRFFSLNKVYFTNILMLCESMKMVGVFFLIFGVLGVKISFAAEPVRTTEGKSEYLITGAYLDFLIDKEGTKKAEDFADGRLLKQFKTQKGELYKRNDRKSVYWVHFTIDRNLTQGQWILELPDPHIDQADLYIYEVGRLKMLDRMGHALPFSGRNFQHKNLVFSVPQQPQTEYYMRLDSRRSCSFMIILKTTEKFTSYALWEYYMLGMYYGILLIMIFYNLFLYLNLRERSYLFYVFYVISCGLYTFREDGIGFQYLWPQLPVLNQWLNNYFESLLLASFSLYSISFFELKKNALLVYRIILADIVIYTSLLTLEVWLHQFFPWKQYLYVFPFIVLYGFAFYFNREGNRYVRYYLIAYSFLLVSVFIFQARIFGYIHHTFFTVYVFNFGFIFEIVLMSFALGEKIRFSTTEKEQAQQTAYEALIEKEKAQTTLLEQLKEKEELKDRINRELERKVQERTVELAEKNSELEGKNQKLATMSARLEEMNSSLDKNNWELNKEVKQKVVATIAGDEIALEDFLKVYPNETACLLYLSELKWKDGFHCQKCGNTKYNNGDTPLSRKCSKCNHRESPTSGTLFHGIKTDLNKAFYITYLSVVNPKKYTLQELSDNLNLGLNTCWKIRKKVLDKKKEMEAKHLPVNKWENYLL